MKPQRMLLTFALIGSSMAAQAFMINFDTVTGGAFVDGFYNGGTDSESRSGPNLGVDFEAGNWQVLTGYGETSAPHFSYPSQPSGVVNVKNGFLEVFRFNYGNSDGARIEVFEGLNGTGNLLATLVLTGNGFSSFELASVPFPGTAHSLVVTSFGGGATFGWDDLKFVPPAPVSDQGALLPMLVGLSVVGFATRRRMG